MNPPPISGDFCNPPPTAASPGIPFAVRRFLGHGYIVVNITDDDIDWVRQVNGRWIVRESLREDAAGFIGHLAKTDPDRLRGSCRRARSLASAHPGEDPKPWFYAGLFSLATEAEAARFLKGHDFTIACIPRFADGSLSALRDDGVGSDTVKKIRRVRAALEAMG